MTVVLRAEATPSAPALLLRPWQDEDVVPLIEVYRDPALRRWTRVPVESVDDAYRWLALQRVGWESRKRISFAVLADDSEGGPDDGPGGGPGGDRRRLLGNVVLKSVNPAVGSAEVGYWTAAYARGQGVAPRALEALTGWAFDTFGPEGLDRLALLHQVDNPASCRVAEKTGYRFDRLMPARPPFPRDGHLHVRSIRPV
ncbi:GNAT family N-acetyltransferase [Plantactinospora soyae]|uniref:RimJ/RimL family protein N-acetyltransferase n=1 Tax=Plantactinospora soyae TaxID=1544732 RepID=A0A927QW79_9ACTN|nr:GNAT family N-acetyltransferase [Plantactinospora soyae]MBE1486585.1 RimJ/RimL family protein N-acetyltransferase [Plantactinospora soyae]